MKLASLLLIALVVSANATDLEKQGLTNLGTFIKGFFDGMTAPGVASTTKCTTVYFESGLAFDAMIEGFGEAYKNPESFFVGITSMRIFINAINALVNACSIPGFTSVAASFLDAENLGVYAIKYFTEFERYDRLRKQAIENFEVENFEDAGSFFGQIFSGVTNFYLS